MSERDPELVSRFAALREAERSGVPEFRSIVTRQPQPAPVIRPVRRAAPVVGVLAAGSVVALALLFVLPARARLAELELARRVMAWRAPLDFLLAPAAPDLLSGVPDLRRALGGSPLEALDPGGELGPPATSRSPQ